MWRCYWQSYNPCLSREMYTTGLLSTNEFDSHQAFVCEFLESMTKHFNRRGRERGAEEGASKSWLVKVKWHFVTWWLVKKGTEGRWCWWRWWRWWRWWCYWHWWHWWRRWHDVSWGKTTISKRLKNRDSSFGVDGQDQVYIKSVGHILSHCWHTHEIWKLQTFMTTRNIAESLC